MKWRGFSIFDINNYEMMDFNKMKAYLKVPKNRLTVILNVVAFFGIVMLLGNSNGYNDSRSEFYGGVYLFLGALALLVYHRKS